MRRRRGVVALDVGGTKIAAGVVTEEGEIPWTATCPTSQEGAGASVAQVAHIVGEAIAGSPRDLTLTALGIAVPGWVDRKLRTVWAPNIAGWDHIALEAELGELPLPIVLDSDRSAYVSGEAWLGAARGLSDVVFLAVGTGIGAGILAEGRILHGHDDLAGAVGWLALDTRFREEYAVSGCLESEASGGAIGRRAGEAASEVVRKSEAGDAGARALLGEAGLYLGMAIANLVSALNPEMVVLGGGLFQSGSFLLDRARGEFRRWAQPFAAERVRLERSALGERAGLLGAARIALDWTR